MRLDLRLKQSEMDLTYIMHHLNSHADCIKYLENTKWEGIPTCPYCESKRSSSKTLRHTCMDCSNSYSVTVGTIFHDSRIPLYKWFMGIVLILSAKKGISSLQLSRDLSINKNTAWLLQTKIRRAMKENDSGLLKGIVEVDETFVGAKINNHYPQNKGAKSVRGGNKHLQPVLGMVQREGKVVAQLIKASKAKQIMPILKDLISPSSTLVTDASAVYYYSKDYFDSHQVLSRSAKKFKKGIYHTSTIEGFWSLLKRAIIGQYHKVEPTYLQSYIDEICFKYNHRHVSDKGFGYLMEKLLSRSFANN